LATTIVEDMTAVWTDGQRLAEQVRAARRKGYSIAAAFKEINFHAVTIDTSPYRPPGGHLSIELETWDHAFRRGIVSQSCSIQDGSISMLYGSGTERNAGWLDRSGAVAQVRALGADGWIGGLARAVLAAVPGGPAAVLRQLASSYEAVVTLKTDNASYQLRLHWTDGEICVSMRANGIMVITSGRVTLRDMTMPESLLLSLPGRPFYQIFDAPFRCESPITHIENVSSNLVITPEPDRWLVNCRTSRFWPAPAPPAGRACS